VAFTLPLDFVQVPHVVPEQWGGRELVQPLRRDGMSGGDR